jgi:hypothetical protein
VLGEAIPDTSTPTTIFPNWDDVEDEPRGSEQVDQDMKAELNVTAEECGLRLDRYRAVCEVKVGSKATEALVDTGASYCIVREAFIVKAMGPQWLEHNVKFPINSPWFTLGDKSRVAARGLVELTLDIAGKQFRAHCWIFSALAYDVLLGWQFLRAQGIDLLTTQDKLVSPSRPGWYAPLTGRTRVEAQAAGANVMLSPTSSTSCVYSDFAGWIQPRSGALWWAFVESASGVGEGVEGLVYPDMSWSEDRPLLANGPATLEAGGRTRVFIMNASDEPIYVSKGLRLGAFEKDVLNEYSAVACTVSDPAYRPELQQAIDDLRAEASRAELEKTKIFLDQVPSQNPVVEVDSEGLPKALDLSGSVLSLEKLAELKSTIKQYSQHFLADDQSPGLLKVQGHDFELELLPEAKPIRLRNRRIADAEVREKAREMTDDMLKSGVVSECYGSLYVANVVLVPKKSNDGRLKLRYAINYSALNKYLKPLAFDLPLVQDVLEEVGGCSIFTSLDLAAGYWQIPIRESDRHIAAFVSPDGRLLQPNRLAFGLMNAPSHFSRFMNSILGSRPACVGRCRPYHQTNQTDHASVRGCNSIIAACKRLSTILLCTVWTRLHTCETSRTRWTAFAVIMDSFCERPSVRSQGVRPTC